MLLGRVVGQTGAWWAALLGSLLGAVLMHRVFAELPLLLSWGLMGGGALMPALVGYNLTG